ncbi:MAG: cobalamin-dependent protein [Spirochaetaceae bacterium]|jgi:methylmalonyl-CoA mutase cobalamin-binding domain/chain|nr:cobalamin-dependent protein [Spirochaetaceae bacterium]
MIDTAKLKQTVGELDEDSVHELLDQFIASKPSGDDARKVVEACQQGMEIVGANFEKGEYFVGDLIFAGELLTASIEKLKPLLGSGGGGNRGVIVLGTVEGDIHDIGKNIFKGMAEAAGFKVVDIGIDQTPAAFVKAVRENKPKIVGLSGVLTLSIDSMKRTIEALKEAGLRDALKVAIGGNAVNPEACAYVGADGWSRNAAEAVKVCGTWV